MKISWLTIFLIFPGVFSVINAQQPDKGNYMLPKLFNDDGDGFIIIGHRGASAYFPENTMAAFKAAHSMGAEMIELDVLLSKDGVPVVFHDAKLDDHTNGSGLVSHQTAKELKKLDAGSWFDPKFSDQRIPTLEEVMKFANGKIAVNIEIKTEAVTDRVKGGVVEKCLKLVEKYGMQNHVLFSSFDYRVADHVNQLNPDMPVALLFNKKISGKKLPSELVDEYHADAFNCSFGQLNKKRLRDIKKHQVPVFVYTVNRKDRMLKLLDKGVTGIFTDKPDLMKEVVGNQQNKKDG